MCFSEPIPRKGTETTPDTAQAGTKLYEVFQNLFPERGLKLMHILTTLLARLRCFSEPIPRKGTETLTPLRCWELWGLACFSEPIPRKGTET